MKLPHCNELFVKFLVPWYPEKDRGRLTTTKGDMVTVKDLAGTSAADVSRLTEESQGRVLEQIDRLLKAATNDWPRYLAVSGNLDLKWVAAFDEHYNRKHIKQLISRSDAAEDGNDYMITCIEAGVVLGTLMKRLSPRLEWCPDVPYWETALFDSKSGTLIPVVHWAIKKLSSYGWDDGLSDKVEACLAFLEKEE